MESNDTTLIILRGPAASGKSTIATELQRAQPNIALIEQDYFRKVLLAHGPGSKELATTMMRDATLTALEGGYHVIIEGILNLEHTESLFRTLFSRHSKNNFMFYLDVPFDETVRRHNARSKAEHFGEEDLRKWYELSRPAERDIEQTFSSKLSVDEIVDRIRQITHI